MSSEPEPLAVAVVGMAGRFPGAKNVAEFWRNLRGGVESVRRFTDEELRAAGVSAELLADPSYVKAGVVLDDLEMFDAPFFGFNPRDASIMDPQHRNFLECAWEALEHAGHAPESFEGSIGVYAGSGMNTYLIYNLLTNRQLVESAGLFLLKQTGNDKDVLATRVSYQLDLRGPAINIQTACSTSLVAIHMACQNLLNHECDMALAGGVTIEFPHRTGYVYREGEILSADGHCRSFDNASSGTVFGSGLGIVVLRRLKDAIEDGDTIHAIVRGSAVNNDGSRKVGYLAPSVDGQAEVIAEALALAGVDAESISYIETHGTGTKVGDPIEISGLTQAYRESTGRNGFCAIGSVKSNIGHLDAAAGVTGFIKTVLALEHGEIPPSLHFEKPNPHIDFANSPFYVNAKLQEWKAGRTPRRAGVTSLGIGGTNAHVILEEAPEMERRKRQRPWQLLVLSAKSPAALEAACSNLAEHLKENPGISLRDVAFTLQAGRKAFPQRRALVCGDVQEAATVLRAANSQQVFTGVCEENDRPVVFLFSGQGSQYVNMGRDLYEGEPAFRKQIDYCSERLQPLLGLNLRGILYPDAGRAEEASELLNQTWITQPALFAIEYALAQMWLSWGIQPKAMAGHSIGEYVAACLAGVFSLDDALEITAVRGRLMQSVPAGAMVAVSLGQQELGGFLADRLSLAAVNDPGQCVVSGEFSEVEALEQRLAKRDVQFRRLRTSHAFHSAMMEPILQKFAGALKRFRLNAPAIPYISNLTGTWIAAQEAASPEYWAAHLRQTVRFADGLAELFQDPSRLFLEVGPGQVLSSLARQHPGRKSGQKVFASLRRLQEAASDQQFALTTLGQLWIAGKRVDWAGFHGTEPAGRVPLPTYPFERKRYWIEPGAPAQPAAQAQPQPVVKAEPSEWFYSRVWKQTELPVPAAGKSGWMVFHDGKGLGTRIAERLRATGQDVVEVLAGRHYSQRSPDVYMIRPGNRPDYDSLWNDLTGRGRKVRRIVHTWAVPSGSARQTQEESLERSFYSPLYLAQALGEQDASGIQIHLVSSNLHAMGGEAVHDPVKAALLGPCKAIPKEFPGIGCRNIDVALSSSDLVRAAEQVLQEAGSRAADPIVAYRGEGRWVETFEPSHPETNGGGGRLRTGGVYLITGGLGGIGLTIAEHLARSLKAKLVLVGRTALPPREKWEECLKTLGPRDPARQKISKLLELEAAGSEVLYPAADVTRLDEMRKVVDGARARFGAIHGVIHAAGVLEDQPILYKTPESAKRVLSPKIAGTLVLDELFRNARLDFLVLCSSISSIAPPAGQVDYCAANAFLDAYAAGRSRQGETAVVAIDWGLWQDVGMGAKVISTDHPLLDRRIFKNANETIYSSEFRCGTHWLLSEHRFKTGTALVPGTGYLEMAVGGVGAGAEGVELRDVFFLAPMTFEPDETREVRLQLKREGAGSHFSIFANGAGWTEQATGQISRGPKAPAGEYDLAAIRERCRREIPFDAARRTRQEEHFDFGPRWRNLERIYLGDGESLSVLQLADEFAGDLANHVIHPALFDLATGSALYLVRGYLDSDRLYLPASYGRISIYRKLPARFYSYIREKRALTAEDEVVTFDIAMLDEQGVPLVEIEEFSMRRMQDPDAASAGSRSQGAAVDWPESRESQAISPAQGVAALNRIVSSGVTGTIVVSPVDPRELLKAAAAPQESQQAAPSGDTVEAKLAEIWEDLLGVKPVGLQDNFFDLGGHSLLAARLSARVKKLFGKGLPLAMLFQAPTIEKLAVLLRGGASMMGSSRVAPLQPNGSRPAFLCIDAGPFLRDLAKKVNPEQPFLGLRLPDTDSLPKQYSLSDVAAYHLATIREIQPEGPYYLGGWSASGLVAYEIAQQLKSQGQEVALLVLFDALNTAYVRRSSALETLQADTELVAWKLKYHAGRLRRAGLRGAGSYLGGLLEALYLNVKRGVWLFGYAAQARAGKRVAVAPRDPLKAVYAASMQYTPEPYEERVVLFRCTEQPEGRFRERELGWSKLIKGLEIHDIPGDHNDIFREPGVGQMAKKLDACLLEAQGARGPVPKKVAAALPGA
jgi:acyl transferase domain-containing protein/thioesterase domain-containing protein